ncbi:MAG: hypothetical protein B7Y15_10480 [Bacteroidetes bacterium 24-39-8]|jgi:signal transduction histidine kinase|nr:MAG: hypothetical protein B7Y69_04775 [Sphingobacteriia bacterium 35-40-8]OYZ49290.1 MAG: hypothetical protein B7Y15_10480 [Bacteroidetes bacterium 24-39-8]OZA67597.1 MAG: hypothetical protein B7X72_03525 [Sphingobacteriia bacterium 39-39-8]HQR93636.1 ATP-binding protein [Sediminibacterium sp.]HQS56044.1 ATP-binding protein [Sediminibacterium sp.]
MPNANEEIKITILIITLLVLFFVLAFLLLINLFRKKNQLYKQEKAIIQANFNQTLLQSQLEIQEQTFNSISQEIHDNVGQILSLAKVQLNIIGEGQTVNQELLTEAKENISKALTDLRDVAKGLSSDRIRVLGLDESIQQEVTRINRAGILSIQFETDGQVRVIEPQKQLILYRVIQECIQNIIKHANANAVVVDFNYREHCLRIMVSDNGKGFNFQEEQLQHHGLGLMNLYKRMELIGGHVKIESEPDKGTKVHIKLPYV